MKYVVSRFNHNIAWLDDYSRDVVLFDRSPEPAAGSIKTPNIGSDIYDKLGFIIDNYHQLPDVAVYTKANLFDYIKPREFEKIKDNTEFTPILSQEHHTYLPTCYYEDGMYYEINNLWYLSAHPVKIEPTKLMKMLGIYHMAYVPFAPGSNYILPKENILKHSKEFYEELREMLGWAVYPGEAMIMERGLYTLWK